MPESKIVIVTINIHPVLGALLVPYLAKCVSNEVVEVEEQAVCAGKNTRFTEEEKKLIAVAQSCTERNLMKLYSRERTVSAFLQKLSEPDRMEKVRHFVEQKNREMAELVQLHAIPLYIRETATKQLFEHHRVSVAETMTEAFFHFELTADVFRYSVNCRMGQTVVSLLKKKPFWVLCAKPAVLVAGKELFVFKRIEAARLIPFFEKPYVEVPASSVGRYVDKIVLPAMIRYPVRFTGMQVFQEKCDCVAELSVSPSVVDQAVLQLHFYYGGQSFAPGQKMQRSYPWVETEEELPVIRYFERDATREQACMDCLTGYGFRQIGDFLFVHPDLISEYALVDWLNRERETLSASFTFGSNELSRKYYVGEIRLTEPDMDDTPDWFELRMTVRIDAYTFPFTSFRKHILSGNRSFTLPDGRCVLLPEEWFEKYADLFRFGQENAGTLRVRKMHLGLLEALNAEKVGAEIRSYTTKGDLAVPARIRATLRTYQQEGFFWLAHLANNGFGGCLADDMGLGKTLQMITLLQHAYPLPDPVPYVAVQQPEQPVAKADGTGQYMLFGEEEAEEERMEEEAAAVPDVPPAPAASSSEQAKASLIVVPTSLLSNWKREIYRFSSLRVYEFTGEQHVREPWKIFGRYPVVLTTYGLLRRHIGLLEPYSFRFVLLDESQNIKNPDSMSYQAVVRLKSENRFVLTGTPIENSLKDLWAQFNFINPGLLGSYSDFRDNYVNPVVKEGNERVRERLRQLIRPFFLRRTKEQVAPELPPLTEEVIYCEMPDEQKELYEKEKNILRNTFLDEWHANKIRALQGITRLRQLANHPRMTMPDYTGSSGKIEQVLDAYETLASEGHKVLIFSSFVTHLNLLAEAFEERMWPYAMLTGSTHDRDGQIARFSTDARVPAFFISLKAGGVGLNLTKADYIFILDPWWNPAAEAQAESRAHRIGQDKQVFVYRFITIGTIEEKIRLLQERKSLLSEWLITENNPLEQLSDADWEDLL